MVPAQPVYSGRGIGGATFSMDPDWNVRVVECTKARLLTLPSGSNLLV